MLYSGTRVASGRPNMAARGARCDAKNEDTSFSISAPLSTNRNTRIHAQAQRDKDVQNRTVPVIAQCPCTSFSSGKQNALIQSSQTLLLQIILGEVILMSNDVLWRFLLIITSIVWCKSASWKVVCTSAQRYIQIYSKTPTHTRLSVTKNLPVSNTLSERTCAQITCHLR